MDGEDIDFLHHELFHQFLSQDDPKSIILYNDTKRSIDKYSKAFKEYQAKSDISYKTKTPISLLIEEITCDLCEYAMSGSEKMYNRLNGLFEGDTLETLDGLSPGSFETKADSGSWMKPVWILYSGYNWWKDTIQAQENSDSGYSGPFAPGNMDDI